VPDFQGRQDGFGLRGMRERAEQMGEMLNLISGRNKGTKIVVASPYAAVESSIDSRPAGRAV